MGSKLNRAQQAQKETRGEINEGRQFFARAQLIFRSLTI